MPSDRPNGREKLNPRQQRFIDAYATPGVSITDAAKAAGYKAPRKQGSRLLDQPKIQAALERSLTKHRVTYDRLGKKLSQLLDAKKGVYFEGARVATEKDNAAQTVALQTGYKLYGHLTAKPDAPTEAVPLAIILDNHVSVSVQGSATPPTVTLDNGNGHG